MQAGGQRFESVILHSARKGKKEHIDILEAKTSKKTQNCKLKTTKNDSHERKPVSVRRSYKERREGRMKDAWALGGDEGRDKLR